MTSPTRTQQEQHSTAQHTPSPFKNWTLSPKSSQLTSNFNAKLLYCYWCCEGIQRETECNWRFLWGVIVVSIVHSNWVERESESSIIVERNLIWCSSFVWSWCQALHCTELPCWNQAGAAPQCWTNSHRQWCEWSRLEWVLLRHGLLKKFAPSSLNTLSLSTLISITNHHQWFLSMILLYYSQTLVWINLSLFLSVLWIPVVP